MLECSGQLLQHTPVIPAHGTMKQEDQHEFKANLSYSETLSQKPTNKQNAKKIRVKFCKETRTLSSEGDVKFREPFNHHLRIPFVHTLTLCCFQSFPF